MPKLTEPGKWRFEVPPNAPPGQAIMINMGCGQCHTPAFQGPRNNMGGYNMNFEYFANLVYNHTTAMPAYRVEIVAVASDREDAGAPRRQAPASPSPSPARARPEP